MHIVALIKTTHCGSIYFMHILVKVLSNQDSATRMALEPVRVQILSLGMVA